MIISVTGHRPDKLGGYSPSNESVLHAFAYSTLAHYRPSQVITGMALGWDTAVAEACISLNIPFIAAIPFLGQESRWPEKSRKKYAYLLSKASEMYVVCEGSFSNSAMQIRNEWMVDRSDWVLALWDGTTGGTANCVAYAGKKNKSVVNVWDIYLKVRGV